MKHKRQHPFYDTVTWRTLRRQIVARDGHRCTVCGTRLGKGETRVDHIQPMKQAPHLALVASNLRTLCAACDNRIRNRQMHGARHGHDERGWPRDPTHSWVKAMPVTRGG